MDHTVEIALALVYLGCLLLWSSYRPKRRDQVDQMAERRARELAGRDA